MLSRDRPDVVKDYILCSSFLLPSLLLMVQRELPQAMWYHLTVMVHDGFGSKEVRCARKQNIDYAK